MERAEIVGGPVETIDGEEFRLMLAAEDASLGVSGRTGNGPPSQRPVNMDRSAAHDFRARGDGTQDRHVPFEVENGLPRPHRAVDDERHLRRRWWRRRSAGHVM